MKPPADATDYEIAVAREMRAAGDSYLTIELALGREGKKGFWAMRCLKGDGSPSTTLSNRGVDWAELSLWKKLDGGRSAKAVITFLRERGIRARKSKEKSVFEGRYDVQVEASKLAEAERLLMHGPRLYHTQKTDSLSCPVEG